MSGLALVTIAGVAVWATAVHLEPLSAQRADATVARFHDFMGKFNRKYDKGSEEYNMRLSLFQETARTVDEHNAKRTSNGKEDFVAGITFMADYTEEERTRLRGYNRHSQPLAGMGARGTKVSLLSTTSRVVDHAPDHRGPAIQTLPAEHSWEHLTAIRNPRSQGGCGSCWAAAAESVLRAHAEIHSKAQNFSMHEIVACSPNPKKCGGSGGCSGSTPALAMEYVLMNGLRTDAEFPHVFTSNGADCPALHSPSVPRLLHDGSEIHENLAKEAAGHKIGMVGWHRLPENKQAPMMRQLVERGPMAISVAAGSFGIYDHGIMQAGHSWIVDHSIVLFGYGVLDGRKYWHVKNSWGSGWGEGGNARLQRLDDEEANCGLDTQPLDGIECEGGRKTVTVCGSFGILLDAVLPIFMPAS